MIGKYVTASKIVDGQGVQGVIIREDAYTVTVLARDGAEYSCSRNIDRRAQVWSNEQWIKGVRRRLGLEETE